MGYELDEFIRMAGFDPYGTDLDRLGAAGNGASISSGTVVVPAENGGDGLIIFSNYRAAADGKRHGPCVLVAVIRADGYSVIRRRELAAAAGLPEVEHVPNPSPGSAFQFVVPPDAGDVADVECWGAGGGGAW